MKDLYRRGLGIVLVCGLLAPVASARDIYVATSGSDTTGTGTSALPYRTIQNAITKAVSWDTIRVRAGIYNESWIQVTKSNLTLVSEDGLYAAKVYSNSGSGRGFRFGETTFVDNCELRGFECYSNYGMGSAGDGLLRIYNCNNIRIKNCLIHDAPNDCDVVKIGGFWTNTTNTLIENCVIYNPAPIDGNPARHAQCLDAHPVNGLTVRGCWIFHTSAHPGDMLIRSNGNSTNVIWENNVFGPSYDDGAHSPATSAGTVDSDTNQVPSVDGMTVRNNLFLSCQGEGAFSVWSSRNVKFYNNIIWNYLGTGAAVSFRNTSTAANQGLDFTNNIVCSTNGKPAFIALGTPYTAGTYTHDYNLYWQVAAGGPINVALEPHSLFVDPLMAAPATPATSTDSWSTIVPDFNLLATSPAINKGYNLGSLVATDINGTSRPQGSAYDVGAYEYFVPNRAPTVDAGAGVAVYENLPVSLHATASDLDGDSLTYSWTRTAGKVVTLTGAGTADLSFTAPALGVRSDGIMTFRIDVSDGHGGTANDSVNVTVYMVGDANHDWFVNVGDLQTLVAAWGSSRAGGGAWNADVDFNADGFVNVGDLQSLVANWARNLSQ